MRNEKHHLVNYIGSLLKDSDYVYFVSYTGLTVAEISDLRNRLAGAQASCHVLKNALIRKAAELSQIQCVADFELAGGTAVVSGKGDPAAAAKVIIDFGKSHDKLAPKGAYFEGALLQAGEVNAIAELPSREVLYSMLLGVLQAPSRNLVSLLNAKAATILNVLNAYKEKREKDAQ